MEDATIVALLLKGDSAGLAEAYRAYADRLFAYSVSMLHDHDAAADIVHDTFIIAVERIGQLRDPARLRSWLYAIARNECLRTARARRRSTPIDEDALDGGGAVSDATEPDTDLRQDELRQLVWSAAEGLNPREREVLELAVRHDLDGTELGSALGVPANHAHALLARARQQLERALGALIVARTGRRDCSVLDELLTGWDGRLTVLLRKRVARHIETCPSCSARKERDVSATALLAATPLLAAPAALRERVLGVGDLQLVGQHTAIAARAGRFGRDGFPIPLDRRQRTRGWPAPVAAAIATGALLVSGLLMQGDGTDTALDVTAPPTVSTGPTPSPTLSAEPSPSASPSVSATTEPSRDEPPPDTTAAPSPTSSSPTSSPPSEPPPPPPDLLSIFCYDDLTTECSLLELIRSTNGYVQLATESETPIAVTIKIVDAPWLQVLPETVVIVPGQPVTAHFTADAVRQCPWTVPVEFTVQEVASVQTLEVRGGCLR